MRYPKEVRGIFLERPNRFIARVALQGREERVHVKNTGRCRELLVPGAQVSLVPSENPARKTAYDLTAVWKGDMLVNIDAQAPNRLVEEYLPRSGLFSQPIRIRPEYTHGDSRFDFLVEEGERRHLMEVKGVTLEQDGHARFPDAPTLRGVKHIRGLADAREEGFESWLVFVVQMEGMRSVAPNDETHPAFAQALRRAAAEGVHVLALGCHVEPLEVEITHEVPVLL